MLGAARPGHCDPTLRGEQQDAGGLGAVLDRELAKLTSAQLRLLLGVKSFLATGAMLDRVQVGLLH